MGPLGDLLATDQRQALEFFVLRLQDVSGPVVDREELLYHASVLSHHAVTSTADAREWAAPANLSTVFDAFVLDTSGHQHSLVLERAGAQCLLLTGFFEDQMRQRHNIRWFAELGAAFFTHAARRESAAHKARLLSAIGARFEMWRQRYALLSRDLRDAPYLFPRPSRPDGSATASSPV